DSPHAWRIVIAGFIATSTLFGAVYSFGDFFKPIATEFGANHESMSTIFSVTAFLYFVLGPITGHLADRLGPRAVVATGAILMGLGLVSTALIESVWAAYFTYGLGVGCGVAFCYVPLIAATSGWFLKRRNTALGIAVSGIGAGTLAVPPVAAVLIEHFGWRGAYAIMGVAVALILLGCALLAEPPPVELEAAAPRLRETLRAPDFVLLYFAGMLWTVATAVPFVFLTPYAQGQGIGPVRASTLLGFIGLASTSGRLGLGALADRLGIVRLYQGCILTLGLSYLIWLDSHSYTGLALFAIAMGASYGGAVTLTPAVLAELFGTQGLGLTLGMLYTGSALGTLLGPPVCGAIVDRSGSYWYAIAFTGATALVAVMILLPLGRLRPIASTAA
ncbi:MAG TPA: MCT family MFS transporter, partial [Candidatus Binataceae bacterium]|nr:MCT family MFS transporter [Candidatus Binataceae bacterium]